MITSTTIKMDMNHSLEVLLKEIDIIEKSKSSISKIKENIENYKQLNTELLTKAATLEKFGFTSTPTYKNKGILVYMVRRFLIMLLMLWKCLSIK